MAAAGRGSHRAWDATVRGTRRTGAAAVRYGRVAGLTAAAVAVAAWETTRRGARRVRAAVAAGVRRAAASTGAGGRRLRTGVAHDARSLAETAVAAGRRLRPEPQVRPHANDEALVAAALTRRVDLDATAVGTRGAPSGLAAAEAGARDRAVATLPGPDDGDGSVPAAAIGGVKLASAGPHGPWGAYPTVEPEGPAGRDDAGAEPAGPHGNGDRGRDAAGPRTFGGRPGRRSRWAGRTERRRTAGSPLPGLVRAGAPPAPTWPAPPASPAPVGPEPAVGQVARPAAGDRPARARRRRDGVVVPLRVPWGTRLRAAAGLILLVVVLGVATAVILAALAVAVSQALGGV